jgi:hypothetical protein
MTLLYCDSTRHLYHVPTTFARMCQQAVAGKGRAVHAQSIDKYL